MRNRDYFSAPYQGNGRSGHGYGHTSFDEPPKRHDFWWWFVISLMVSYFVWQYAR